MTEFMLEISSETMPAASSRSSSVPPVMIARSPPWGGPFWRISAWKASSPKISRPSPLIRSIALCGSASSSMLMNAWAWLAERMGELGSKLFSPLTEIW